ncbi:hypothetical protein CEP54_016168 [Fusarium duplospermum]|uniref:Uncharacterized protein n=1 Tax=Fusarium duplospermum TaxID=1325734 RepID=A0A428NHD2_9HYPO|nr:hypothetical protein CEP54_016168 [Fusarium duplospermum]
MAPPSPGNAKFVNAIKNIAAIAFEGKSGFSIECTDNNDDENNDKEAVTEKIVVSLQSSGSSELLQVEAENEIGGLLDLMDKTCDEAIKRGSRSSPSEEDIYACAEAALLLTGNFSILYRHVKELSTTYASLDVNETKNETKSEAKNLATAKGKNNKECSLALVKTLCEKGLSARRMLSVHRTSPIESD